MRDEIDTKNNKILSLENELLQSKDRENSTNTPTIPLLSPKTSTASSNSPVDMYTPNTSNIKTPSGVFAVEITQYQSMLKQKIGEIEVLKSRLKSLEMARDSLAEELVSMSEASNQLKEEEKQIEDLKNKLKEAKDRETLLLDMLGEKEEKIDDMNETLVFIIIFYIIFRQCIGVR